MHSISVVTPKVVFQCCYLALTLFSYRKANHFIDAAKLLFKVSIFLSSFTHIRTAGNRNRNIDLSNYHRTVNCMIPLSFAEGLLYVQFCNDSPSPKKQSTRIPHRCCFSPLSIARSCDKEYFYFLRDGMLVHYVVTNSVFIYTYTVPGWRPALRGSSPWPKNTQINSPVPLLISGMNESMSIY